MLERRRKARHHRYVLRIQLGLIAALSVTIAAFKADVRADPPSAVATTPVEAPPLHEVPQTNPVTAPPPPRPAIPAVVPDDAPLQVDELRLDAGLPVDAPSSLPPPPGDEEAVFVIVEDMPELVGGMASLYERVAYPQMAKQARVEGKVIVGFIVDREGNVADPVVLRGVHPLLDEAALGAVRGLRFRPGRQRDRPVAVRMSLPIVFRLR